jgi:chitin disaccharide deacetylase
MTNVVLPKYLIVNADDFGLSPGVNAGIIKAHEHGIVTSASLMVRWPAAAEAAAYAQTHPDFSIGLHVDLGEWVFVDGAWQLAYEVVPMHDAGAVEREIAQQIRRFRGLMGCNPTHLDSHQHVHRDEPVRSILQREAQELRVRLRHFDRIVYYTGNFYGQSNKGDAYPQGISVEALLKILNELPSGITELGCHPGEGGDARSIYGVEREQECRTLCDPRVIAALRANDIQLCSFSHWPLLTQVPPASHAPECADRASHVFS